MITRLRRDDFNIERLIEPALFDLIGVNPYRNPIERLRRRNAEKAERDRQLAAQQSAAKQVAAQQAERAAKINKLESERATLLADRDKLVARARARIGL